MRIARRRLLTAAIAVSAIGAPAIWKRGRADAKYVAKLNIAPPTSDPLVAGVLKFSALVGERTGGAVELRLFPDNQLGSDAHSLEAMKIGSLEGSCTLGSQFTQYVPLMGVCDLPFVFRDPAHAQKAGTIIQKTLMADLADAGFYLLAIVNDGDRDIAGSSPMVEISDIKGKKIRVSESPIMLKTWQLLGANPTPVPSAEVYLALQTKVLDAVDTTSTSYVSFKRYEVAKHLSNLGYGQAICAIAFSNRWIQKLPSAHLTALKAAAEEFMPNIFAGCVQAEAAVLASAPQMGFFVHDIRDRDAWVAATAPIRDEFASRSAVARQMLDEIGAIT